MCRLGLGLNVGGRINLRSWNEQFFNRDDTELLLIMYDENVRKEYLLAYFPNTLRRKSIHCLMVWS